MQNLSDLGPYKNEYADLQAQKSDAKELTATRERIRNLYIDNFGAKPSDQDIDEIMLILEGASKNSQQSTSTLLQQQLPQAEGTNYRVG
jgi:hypothetical protein